MFISNQNALDKLEEDLDLLFRSKTFENKKIPTLSLVECKLETGRTHQIRVHMKHKGNNILGDKKYKKKFKKLKNVSIEIENDLLFLIGSNLRCPALLTRIRTKCLSIVIFMI